MYHLEDQIRGIRELFNNAKDLKGAMEKYLNEHEAMKKQIEGYRAQVTERTKDELVARCKVINGINVVKGVLPVDAATAKDLVFKVRQAIPEQLVCVLGTVSEGKPLLNVMLSDDMVKDYNLNAGQLVREAAKLIKGGGGGQPHFASAGGKDPDGLSAAVDKVISLAVK